MRKSIQFIVILSFIFPAVSFAQDNTTPKINSIPVLNGFYQKIDLDSLTPCSCDQKTQRTYDLAKGLRPNDIIDYDLHTYRFKFGNSTVSASKLFKALEKDLSVYKVSMKEWDSFMLLTTLDFNVASFEMAAQKVFASFSPILPGDFLKFKSMDAYNEYLQKIEKEERLKQTSIQQQNGTH